jgi:hypothetical protein
MIEVGTAEDGHENGLGETRLASNVRWGRVAVTRRVPLRGRIVVIVGEGKGGFLVKPEIEGLGHNPLAAQP